ncbi:hypothetical protein A1Q1_06322 [Trichosporon asahii var. asahii CBS 2479]|uniref:Uncharacterized protein n=1 Tax=Trichosporon asahii var. asahii (strain ATCC 90039 / CBS 2479 / JCM 2466 / KCTC 7840 / NBRC 103889/ NCYC 2677 / UAMH 7654) TaxID=1186058 RepID=J5TQS1_TRIAS|nr:hypothetical protein A1Q1_06322 [Trichosporon asahii var. asahii CBS 2479]EJT52216.1 hypothetical protein A1Q1_06322 [Trichosporon asahii var. asahii CBS 2479]
MSMSNNSTFAIKHTEWTTPPLSPRLTPPPWAEPAHLPSDIAPAGYIRTFAHPSPDGIRKFSDEQLRAAHPSIAEAAIAYRDQSPEELYHVIIDQVQPNIVRLRGRYASPDLAGQDPKAKLLYGVGLGMPKEEYGSRIYLQGTPGWDRLGHWGSGDGSVTVVNCVIRHNKTYVKSAGRSRRGLRNGRGRWPWPT